MAASGLSSGNGCDASQSDSESDSENMDLSKGAVGDIMPQTRDMPPGCKKHLNEPIAAYCQTCEEPVCFKCWTDPKHASHDMTSCVEWKGKRSDKTQHRPMTSDILKRAKAKLEKLTEFESKVKSGHKKEIRVVKAKESLVLGNLRMKFDRQVHILEEVLERQTASVKKTTLAKVEKIQSSCEKQLQQITDKKKKVEAVVGSLQVPSSNITGSETATQNPKTAGASTEDLNVSDLKTIDVMSGQLQLEDFTQLDDFPAAVTVTSASDMSESTNAPSPTTGTGTTVPSSAKGMGIMFYTSRDVKPDQRPCAIIPADRVPHLRSRIASLIPRDVTKDNDPDEGKVVITRKYHIDCRAFAEGKTNVFPGPLQYPDLQKSYGRCIDVTYLLPGDAAALCVLVGGKPAVTYGDSHSWNNENNMAFRNAALYDQSGNALVMANKSGDRPHDCNLPVGDTFHNAIEKYAGFYPSVVKEKGSGKVIDHSTTVGGWGSSSAWVRLTVIKG